MTTKLLSRWHGPYEVVEKMGDKTYVIMMPFKGEMKPMVQNFRNLWKVGRATDQPAAVEMSDFTDIFEEGDLSNDGEKERDLNENDKEQAHRKSDDSDDGNNDESGDESDNENDDDGNNDDVDEKDDNDVTKMHSSGVHVGAKNKRDEEND